MHLVHCYLKLFSSPFKLWLALGAKLFEITMTMMAMFMRVYTRTDSEDLQERTQRIHSCPYFILSDAK